MSAYIVSYESMDRVVGALALATARIGDFTLRDQWGDTVPSAVITLGKVLFRINAASTAHRYPNMHVASALGSVYKYEGQRITTTGRLMPSFDERVSFFKALQHFLYQCEEDVTNECPIVGEVREAAKALAVQLVEAMPAYMSAPWS